MKTIVHKITADKKFSAILLGFGLAVGFLFGIILHSPHSDAGSSAHQHTSATEAQASNQPQIWTCSMHPQIKQNKPGLCPICAMDLVPMASGVDEGEHVDPNEIQMTESALALASVQTTIVKRGVPEKDVHLLGRVKADERRIAELTARFGGRIEKLFINYTGQHVTKGQKLGTIYSPELISAQKELLEAIKYKETSPSFYKSARTKLKLWDLTDQQIDAIEKNSQPKTYFDILSPITGTVMKRYVALGDYVKEGSALFKVVDLSKVWVMFDAYESDLPWIEKDDVVAFSIQSVAGKQFSGAVTYIDPFIDAQSRVAQVRVELDNPAMELKPEMFVNGVLTSRSAENSNELLLPKSSILWTGKRSVVYVKVPDRETVSFLRREIVLGPDAGNFYVVSEGISEGEEIATNGVFKIDAAAQLAGKSSMMNPQGATPPAMHNHGKMDMADGEEHAGHSVADGPLKHETFPVSGNCDMCKSTIESTVRGLPGIHNAEWNIESKQLHISYDEALNSLGALHKAIAQAGYDTEMEIAPKSAYDKLPACCQYTRTSALVDKATVEQTTFKVSGNCGMCKETIETAVKKLNGVNEAEWDQETKEITVTFNADKVALRELHKAIANAGYDTELEKADDEVFRKLPACCQYTRE